VIYLYLEQFQEKVLDRTSFFGTRHGHLKPNSKPASESLASDASVRD